LENQKEGELETYGVILEIRAGVGGDEAAIFASDLLKMYNHYAERQNWPTALLDSSTNEIGGIKEAVLEIQDSEAYTLLKYEGGVHRVQRVPETEKMAESIPQLLLWPSYQKLLLFLLK